MPTIAELISSVLQDAYPGVWQQDNLCLPARTDTRVPHIHGRVPDLVELGDLPIPTIDKEIVLMECESYSSWFNPAQPAPQEAMEIVEIPAGVQRPVGAPLVQVIVISAEYIVVRNWHELQHFTRLISMSRTGPPEFEELAGVGVRCDFTADKVQLSADPDTVVFTDLTTYAVPGFEPESWEWDFGDDETSTEQNPSHDYTGTSPGDEFTVTLRVTFKNGQTCSVVKTDYIERV